MAITSITDISYRQGGRQRAGESGGVARETTVVYQVLHTANEPFVNIRAALGVLPFFSVYPPEPDQVAQSIDISREPDSREVSYVTVEYSNQVDRQEPEEENPLDRSVKINVSSVVRKERTYQDRDGEAIKNSAGDFFEDTPPFDIIGLRLQFQKNFLNAPGFLLTHPNTLNSATVTVSGRTWSLQFPQETLKFQSFSMQEDLFQNDVVFNAVQWELEYRQNGWAYEPMDRGYNATDQFSPDADASAVQPILIPFFEADSGNPLPRKDTSRRRPSAPWPLDGAGGVITFPDIESPEFITFNIYETSDFTSLPGVS